MLRRVEVGVNPNAHARDNWSCLMMATRNCEYWVVLELLIDYSAIINGPKDMFGRGALDMIKFLMRDPTSIGGVLMCDSDTMEGKIADRQKTYDILIEW
jgi:hypothetical protein